MRGDALGRRAFSIALLAAGCSKRSPGPAAGDPPEGLALPLRVEELRFDGTPSTRALVVAPPTGGPFPVLVALHGRGEAVRGPDAGAHGWLRDYRLDRTLAALQRGKPTREDLEGLADDAELVRLAKDLETKPYRGLVVVCPHTPDILSGARSVRAADAFADFVVDTLLPKVHASFSTTKAVGIDGVSLGGRVALLSAARRPAAWKAVGTLQAAVREPEVAAFADEIAAFRKASSARLRLLTSTDDPFRPPLAALSAELRRRELAHEHVVIGGPHDYSFNRGPGGFAMLTFHDRALRDA